MKKRLRKKQYIGEFKEWGVTISIARTSEEGLDEFLDEFIAQGMEGNSSFFTGTSEDGSLEGFIDLGASYDAAGTKLASVNAWLDKRSDVKNYTTGTLTDAWYGPFGQPETAG